MKHVIAAAAAAVAVVASLAFVPASSFAAQAKGSAKGVVSAVGTDSLTVKVSGKDMTFGLDDKTGVIAKGASTATKEAKKEGMKGAKFSDVVKVGDEVEVSYKDAGGKMLASNVRVTKKAATK